MKPCGEQLKKIHIFYTGVELLAQRIPQYETEVTAWFQAQYEDLSLPNSEKYEWLVSSLRPYSKYHFKAQSIY